MTTKLARLECLRYHQKIWSLSLVPLERPRVGLNLSPPQPWPGEEEEGSFLFGVVFRFPQSGRRNLCACLCPMQRGGIVDMA